MPRFWNTGICLMTLLINGLKCLSDHTLPSTGPPTATYTTFETTGGHQNGLCPNGTLPITITQCMVNRNLCGANAGCPNTSSGYRCKCDEGYLNENEKEFCISKDKKKNRCEDIDECSKYPDICGSNLICSNTLGSYNCICGKGFTQISNKCVERATCTRSSCGLNSICNSSENVIKCSCQQGYRASSQRLQHPQCNVNCKYNTSKKKCEHEFHCNLQDLIDNFTPFCENVTSQDELSLEKFLEDLDNLINGFSYFNKTDRLQKAGHLLNKVESTVQNLALLKQKAVSHVNKNKTISIQVTKGTPDSGSISLQGTKSSIKLDSKTAAGNTGVALLGCIEYTNITHILEGADLLEEISENTSLKLVSPVVSVFLGIINTSHLQQPVSIRLSLTEKVKSTNMSCVSWSVPNNAWSTKGCVMVDSDTNGITCNCTHLTSFAVLMLLQDPYNLEHIWALTLLTQIGLSISIFCLVLAIITFYFCRSLHGTRNTIHMHLCISLFLGNCIFLLGIEATHNKVLCRIVAGLLHAFYLCSFCWMALEGLELYLMLVKVFKTHLKKRYLLAVGYGTPLLIVTISSAIYHQGYGTEKYCWLTRDYGFIWAFMGPVCAIILANCGIFVLTVWKLADKMSSVSPDQGKLKRIRILTMTSLAQLCILGSCWAFGFFMFSSPTIFFTYAFTILNTLQGLQIFCLHCLMHKKVRAEYKMWLCALAHFKAPVYSEFSNTSNTHSHSKGKTSKESGL